MILCINGALYVLYRLHNEYAESIGINLNAPSYPCEPAPLANKFPSSYS